MINLSELVRKEGNLGMFNSLKFAYDFDVYLAEDVGDFLVNRDRVYVSQLNSLIFYFLILILFMLKCMMFV